MIRIGVLVGAKGRGSNLMAILNAITAGAVSGQVTVVIGSLKGAPALDAASSAGVETVVVGTANRTDDEYGAVLLRAITKRDVDLIVLAGYMRRLPDALTTAFAGRIINIHPSLLPAFGGHGMYGRKVHEAVREAGVTESGCTVHVVDNEYDHGPVVAQRRVDVLADDSVDDIATRVLGAEHSLLVDVLADICSGKRSLPLA
jgi:formyltetrahydrofolate-dependent phosphoribosylglycinamide formyltransferase